MKAKKKENKYIILKIEDVENYFSQFTKTKFTTAEEQANMEQEPFWTVVDELNKANKNKYIIVNQDERYAELVWQIVLLGEDAKEIKKDLDRAKLKRCEICEKAYKTYPIILCDDPLCFASFLEDELKPDGTMRTICKECRDKLEKIDELVMENKLWQKQIKKPD